MKDWLGTSSDLKFLPFEEAREYVRTLGLKNNIDWQQYCKSKNKPNNIPKDPDQRYKRLGWINYKDWLNQSLKEFNEAKKFVKTLNLKNYKEWTIYCKGEMKNLPQKPNNIPRDPNLRYRKDWINWEDWLTGETTKIYGEWRAFKEAREFVRNLNLNGSIDWKKYCKGELEGYESKPKDIPTSPEIMYKNKGWIDYADWLGTTRKRRGNNIENDNTWLSYEEARAFVHSLKLNNEEEWRKYIKAELIHLPDKPNNIPNSPLFVYKDAGWNGMNDWLGNGSTRKTRVKNALPFEKAREFVRSLGLKKYDEWQSYIKGELDGYEPMPDNIPKSPSRVYKDCGWLGYPDWLGINNDK